MAYGPSGSGKTYNLIGQDFTSKKKNGVIKYALNHIMRRDDVKDVVISSYQYYNYCNNRSKICLKFDSLSSNVKDFDIIKKDITNENIKLQDYLDKVKLKTYYKFEQSSLKYAITLDSLTEIILKCFGINTLDKLNKDSEVKFIINTFENILEDNKIKEVEISFRKIGKTTLEHSVGYNGVYGVLTYLIIPSFLFYYPPYFHLYDVQPHSILTSF